MLHLIFIYTDKLQQMIISTADAEANTRLFKQQIAK